MAKAKTATSKKASTAKSASAKKPAVKSEKTVKNKFTIADLKRKVTDPKNRRSLLIALSVIVIAVLLFLGRGIFIAATVNGQPVSRFSVISELEKQSGAVVLENTITRMLVKQEARKQDVEVSEEDINKEIERISKQFKDQGQDLNSLLQAQGLSEEKFKEEVRIQLLVTRILGNDAKVSDDEFNKFMTENPDLISEDENEATARATLRTQLEQQKLAQKYQEWIQKIKSEAKINYFVNY